MVAAEKRLEELNEATIREAESWDLSNPRTNMGDYVAYYGGDSKAPIHPSI